MRHGVQVWCQWIGAATLLVALSARAELPVDTLLTDPVTNEIPRGIIVPGPERPGSTGTSTEASSQPEPAPVPQFHSVMRHWKLVPAPELSADSLALRNSDALQGDFVGLDSQVLGWRMDGVAGMIRFQRQGLSALRLRSPPPPKAAERPVWVVQLGSGSLLSGQSLALDDQEVVLGTSYAGLLRLPRAMVSVIYHDAEPAKSAFRLLQNLERWSQIQTGQGELRGLPLFRALDLPDAFLVEFDYTLSQRQNLQVHLPLSEPQLLYSEPHLVCIINREQVLLSPTGENVVSGVHSPVRLPKSTAGRWRIGVAVSRSQGLAVLYVDGKEMQRYRGGLVMRPQAKGMALLDPSGTQAGVSLRTLVVSRINEELQMPASKPGEDLLRLANGDALVGQLESITASNLVCRGPFGRLEMPLERLVGVVLATAKRAEPRRRASDVVVQLVDGGHVTAELKEFAPQQLTLASDLFGQIQVDRAAVSGIRFGLYQPAAQQASADARPGRIGLISETTLEGALVGLAKGQVTWRHPYAAEPIVFSQSSIRYANPIPSTATTNLAPLASSVQLTNGDSFRGELALLDSQQLQVRSMYSGVLTVARRYLAGLFPNLPGEGVLDAGQIERWSVKPPNAASARNQANRQYLRNAHLPDRVCFQMQVQAQPGQWNLTCTLFGTSHDRNPLAVRQGYYLMINSQQISLHEATVGGRYSPPSNVPLPKLAAGGSYRLTWLADRAKGESFLLIDGKLVLQRRNIKASVPGQLLLVTVGNRQQCEVGEVVLQAWNGRPEELLANDKATGDRLWLHDWSSRTGPIGGIRDGQVLLPRAETLGLRQIAALRFDPSQMARARRTKADVRVSLVNGDSFTLMAPQLEARGLVGTAEGLGTIVIDPQSVVRLDFQPYEPPPQPKRHHRFGYFGGMILN